MKVFISYSGQRSAAVADALRYWLPKVIQALEPWISADDIEKGTRWRSGLASELEQSSVGIICLTRDNLNSTWIHFEAGALSKQQQNTYVCTFLFDLEPTDVREPLAQFQATKAQKDDLRKLLSTINNVLGDSKLSESELSESFDVWWPRLAERLKAVPPSTDYQQPIRGDREILEEILELVRGQSRETRSFWPPLSSRSLVLGSDLTRRAKRILAEAFGRPVEEIEKTRFDPEIIRELLFQSRDRGVDGGRESAKEATLAEIEANYVSEILAATKGNKTEAARILGISRKNLYERIARLSDLAEQVMDEEKEATSEEDKLKDNLTE